AEAAKRVQRAEERLKAIGRSGDYVDQEAQRIVENELTGKLAKIDQTKLVGIDPEYWKLLQKLKDLRAVGTLGSRSLDDPYRESRLEAGLRDPELTRVIQAKRDAEKAKLA